MAFTPLATAKAHPWVILFWIVVGFVLVMAIDDRVGQKISGFVKGLPLVGKFV